MKPNVLLILAVLMMIVLLGACSPGTAQDAETGSEEQTSGGESLTAAVEISGFKFNPEVLTITAGTTVTWTNLEAAPHSAVGDNEEWDSGALRKNDAYSFTFDTPGTYTYHDYYYPAMHGTIEVTE